jgi:hypothetical protein
MHDVAPGFLRPNPNPSSQDVPGPWFRLLYIIHPHQSMIPCLSGRLNPSELQEPAHGFLLLVCYRSLRGRRPIPCSAACISMALSDFCLLPSGFFSCTPVLLSLYHFIYWFNGHDDDDNYVLFSCKKNNMVNVMWLSVLCVTTCLSVTVINYCKSLRHTFPLPSIY